MGILCLAAQVCGQSATSSPPASKNTFASEPYVLKSASTINSMNADGTGTCLQTFAIAVQSDAALRDLSVLTITFSSQSEHADFVYARVVHPDGTIGETPIADAIEQPAPVTREAPLYSDLETKQLPIKSMRIGDTLEWQVRFTTYHAEVPGQFWGQDTFVGDAVVLDETYELRVPAGLHLTVWTNPRAGANVSESNDAGQHIYRWHHADLHPTVGAEAEAAKKAESTRLLTPDEELDAEKGKLPSFAWTTFSDWAAVGAWYNDLVASRIAPDEAIKSKVAELTVGKTTDLEKAQAVYNFVSSRIRYVGVDFGVGRYQPHTAAEVFANQYGDCKDKHILLASMLSVLNLRADPVLVGAGIRFNTAVPSPASFNHLITHLMFGGKDVWLDSTAEVGIWGALLKGIRDQDALIISASAPAVVAQTPVDLPYPQSSTEVVDGSLDSSLTSESKIAFTLRDDDELILRSVLRNVSPADYGTFVQRMMGGMGFGGTTSEPEIEHLDDPSQPLAISFHYHRVKEKDWGDNRITAAFQPILLPYFTADQPPTSTILLGPQRTESSTVSLHLPTGWSAQLPEAVHTHAAFAKCDVTYNIYKDMLVADRRFTVLESKVPIKDFQAYQSWYDECGASGVPYIQLFPAPKVSAAVALPEPKAPDAPTGSAEPANPSDPKAAELLQKAMQSGRSFDLDNARKFLDQATAINPTEPLLWSAYAGLASLLGMKNQAIEDMQRELTYHPDEVQFYSGVANAQRSNGNTKGSLDTLRAWVKAAPNSPAAAVALAHGLMSDKDPADALKEASSAIDRIESSGADVTDLRIVAANAQVDLGRTSLAANSVAPLLKTVTDPDQIDNIAHILAEGSAYLTEAETAEAKVLDASEAKTQSWAVGDELRPIMLQELRIAAEWDTMALILFHQGKFGEALGYVSAALRANYNKDEHDHLAAINSVLRNPATTATLRDDDDKLRTYRLGSSNGRSGVAAFVLLIADGKVLDSTPEKFEPGSMSTLPDAAQRLKAADLKALSPPGSMVRLVRHGLVNCHNGICELVLAPLN
jgi:tetratricopeptide (TPR) repeat protein